ncbi:MAG: IPT/TIG domain-containing protein [Prolixibacteraceae bacterium]|nr:IPT/TIG domain-containing protein [Prolixibacteraceae bacterium]
MVRHILNLILGCIFLTGSYTTCNATSTAQISSENLISITANCPELSQTNVSVIRKDFPNDKISGQNKSTQVKVTPSSGSYLGGCGEDGYYVKITGESFGNGWDISSVTICGVEVCQIVMQSSDLVIVYPGAGTPGTGDIVITSKSMGKTTIEKAFTYQSLGSYNKAKNINNSNVENTTSEIGRERESGE